MTRGRRRHVSMFSCRSIRLPSGSRPTGGSCTTRAPTRSRKKIRSFSAGTRSSLVERGMRFPISRCFPSGSWTHLAWKRERSPWTRIEFLAEGEMRVESEQFRAWCAGLIDQVVRRLDALSIDGTLLQEEWSAIQSADSDEFAFCSTAAQLGWDPYAVEESRQTLVMKLAEQLQGAVSTKRCQPLIRSPCTRVAAPLPMRLPTPSRMGFFSNGSLGSMRISLSKFL